MQHALAPQLHVVAASPTERSGQVAMEQKLAALRDKEVQGLRQGRQAQGAGAVVTIAGQVVLELHMCTSLRGRQPPAAAFELLGRKALRYDQVIS